MELSWLGGQKLFPVNGGCILRRRPHCELTWLWADNIWIFFFKLLHCDWVFSPCLFYGNWFNAARWSKCCFEESSLKQILHVVVVECKLLIRSSKSLASQKQYRGHDLSVPWPWCEASSASWWRKSRRWTLRSCSQYSWYKITNGGFSTIPTEM